MINRKLFVCVVALDQALDIDGVYLVCFVTENYPS
jgi:hypothetical protein